MTVLERPLRIVIAGSQNVGKTRLIKTYIADKHILAQETNYTYVIKHVDHQFKLEIYEKSLFLPYSEGPCMLLAQDPLYTGDGFVFLHDRALSNSFWRVQSGLRHPKKHTPKLILDITTKSFSKEDTRLDQKKFQQLIGFMRNRGHTNIEYHSLKQGNEQTSQKQLTQLLEGLVQKTLENTFIVHTGGLDNQKINDLRSLFRFKVACSNCGEWLSSLLLKDNLCLNCNFSEKHKEIRGNSTEAVRNFEDNEKYRRLMQNFTHKIGAYILRGTTTTGISQYYIGKTKNFPQKFTAHLNHKVTATNKYVTLALIAFRPTKTEKQAHKLKNDWKKTLQMAKTGEIELERQLEELSFIENWPI